MDMISKLKFETIRNLKKLNFIFENLFILIVLPITQHMLDN